MELRIIQGAIVGNKIQKFLAFLTVFLASMLIATILNLTLGIGDQVAKELRSYGSNIIVLPRGNSLSVEIDGEDFRPLASDSYLDEAHLRTIKEIFWRNNVVGFAPFLDGEIIDDTGKKWSILGSYFDKNVIIEDEPNYHTGVRTIYPFWSVEGEWISDDSSHEILIGKELADAHSMGIGDVITLKGEKFFIKGILHGDAEKKIIMPLSVVQKLLNREGKVARVEVSVLTIPENDLSIKARRDPESLDALEYDVWYCTAYASSIAYQIEEAFHGSSAKALMRVSGGESSVVKKIQSLMMVITVITLLASSIGIASLIAAEIHRRKKEIGLLKALGASAFSIYTLFIAESLLIAFVAGIVGTLAGYALSNLMAFGIFDHGVGISYIVLPLSVSFALFVILIGSLISMRGVIELSSAEVLYGRK